MSSHSQSSDFLYVIKDRQSQSLSRSEGDMATSIKRHVQFRRARQRQEILKSSSDASRRIAQRGFDLKDQSCSRPSSNLTHTYYEPPDPQTATSGNQISASPRDFSNPKFQLLKANFSEGDTIDPFNSTALKFDKKVQFIYDYFLSTSFIPKGEAVSQPQSLQPRNLCSMEEYLRGCLSNETHMYGLLAGTASYMKCVAGLDMSSAESVDYFMQKGLRSLRTHLSSCGDETGITKALIDDKQIILSILDFCSCEWFQQNHSAALMHLRVASYLMKMVNPASSDFERFIYEMACHHDLFLAIENATSPMFPLTCDPRPLPPLQMKWIRLKLRGNLPTNPEREFSLFAWASAFEVIDGSKLPPSPYTGTFQSTFARDLRRSCCDHFQSVGQGFADALTANFFVQPMASIIDDLIPFLEITMYFSLHSTPTKSDELWMAQKGHALSHRLVSHVPSKAQTNNITSHWRKEECCRLALMILLTTMSGGIIWKACSKIMFRLQQALSGIDWGWESDDEVDQHVEAILLPSFDLDSDPLVTRESSQSTVAFSQNKILLWVLVTGMFAAEASNPTEEAWFLARAVHVATKLGVITFSQLHQLVCQHVYMTTLQQPSLIKLGLAFTHQ